ncbi:MAG: ABC transporter transmembrane domain-containing protein [Gammaproteobacteria bacterium]
MSDQPLSKKITVRDVLGFFGLILGKERNYYVLALVYGIGISVLSLALPISVQMLVNTVANTGLPTPLLVLSLTLFFLLVASGLLNALRIHVMDMFGRRFYARMVSEIATRSVFALNPFFQDYNKGALFNRYFDILIVQKNVPNLLVGGFTTMLQAGVGFILVSSYHPWFLAFNLVIILVIWLIWLIWGGRAIMSSVEVSHKKHAAAAWLEGLGGSNGFFKSERHIDEAMKRTDAVTAEYMEKHVKHFRHHFSQTLCFLLLYATASATLLGLGGWLVIQGELTLGQLVAAELVLSVVFFGISQMGIYMAYFYELCAAIEELSLFYDVEQDDPADVGEELTGNASVEFVKARGEARGIIATLDFVVPSGARVHGVAETYGIQREVTNFLKRHIQPTGGYVALGGQDIAYSHAHSLRQQIIVLDRPNAIEMTIREYLQLSGESVSSKRLFSVLKTVGLGTTITQLQDGLDTRVSATGWPLTITETMQLKLAAAIIAQPRVLVMGELYDTMTDRHLIESLNLLQKETVTTVLYFSSRSRDLEFTSLLYLSSDEQKYFDTFEELLATHDEREARLNRRNDQSAFDSSGSGV